MVFDGLFSLFKKFTVDDLLKATRRGNFEEVKSVLAKGIDINAKKENEVTALHIASGGGNVKIVRLLLEKGADLNAFSSIWGTPLFMAAENGRIKVVKLLLEKGADVNVEKKNGISALSLAQKKNHDDVIQLLLDKGAKKKVESLCEKCNGKIDENIMDEAMKSAYPELCSDCILDNYDSIHSVQDMQLKDGTMAKVVKSVPIEKDKVEQLDISDIDNIMGIVAEELRTTGTYQPWNVTISGYDEDPRSLIEIPEVRAWCKKCFDDIPSILAMLSQSTIDWFAYCAVETNPARNAEGKLEIDTNLSAEDTQKIITSGIFAWNFFAECGIADEQAGKMSQKAQRRLPWLKDMPEF